MGSHHQRRHDPPRRRRRAGHGDLRQAQRRRAAQEEDGSADDLAYSQEKVVDEVPVREFQFDIVLDTTVDAVDVLKDADVSASTDGAPGEDRSEGAKG